MKRRWAWTLVRFALIFIVSMAVLAVLWPRIAPQYARMVSALARPVFRVVEDPNVTIVDVEGDQLWIKRQDGDGGIVPVVWFDRYVFLAVVPFLGLLMGTPGLGVRRRATRALIGLAALYVVHVGYIVVSVELIYAAVMRGITSDGWQIAVRVLWESAPILIWVALTAGAWKRVLQSLRTEGVERANSVSAEPVRAEG